jgi:hypothetical protein
MFKESDVLLIEKAGEHILLNVVMQIIRETHLDTRMDEAVRNAHGDEKARLALQAQVLDACIHRFMDLQEARLNDTDE